MFKFLRNLNLAIKLNAILMLLLGVMLLTILLVLTNRTAELTGSTGQQRVLEEAEVIRQRFAEAEADVLATARLLASSPELVAALDRDNQAIVQRIAILQTTPLGLDGIDIVDADGEYVTAVVSEEFDEGAEAEMFTFSLLGIDVTNIIVEGSDLLLVGTTPVRNAAGQIVGAVLASRLVDDAFMAEINFNRTNIHVGLAYKGQIVAKHDGNQADPTSTSGAEDSVSLDFNNLLDEAAIQQALSGQTVAKEETFFSEAGIAHLVGYTPLTVGGTTEAAFILQTSVAELISFRSQLVGNMTIIVAILALVAVGIFVFFVSRTVTQPIKRLATAAQEMGAGNLTATLPPASNDEVGQLTNSFGQMAVQLRQTVGQLDQRARQMESSAEVSRRLSTLLDEQELVTAVINQLQEAFNYYHVHIYLLNEAGNTSGYGWWYG